MYLLIIFSLLLMISGSMAQIHPGTQEVRISDLETPTPVHIHQVL
jgi:hypothetical protein